MSRDKVSIVLPDLSPGGAERVGVNLANAFVARGIAVDVVLMRCQGSLLDAIDPRVNIVDLCAPRPRHVLLPLVHYLRRARVDAMLANTWPLTILAVLARRMSRARLRLVVLEHTTWSKSQLVRHWRTRMTIRTTMRWLLPKADAVVAVSEGAARDLEQFGGLRQGSVKTLYNPVAHADRRPTTPLPEAASAWAAGSHKRILAVGTLKAVKDFPTLLRAFVRVRGEVDVRLLILGEGEERSRLEALVRSLGLDGLVELPGYIADTTPIYASADLFVLSSTNEGFGNVIVEALEQGVPVVATDCPCGPSEILDHGKYGALVPVGDVEAMAAAMLDSLKSEHDHMALKSRALDFSVEEIAGQYLQLLMPHAGAARA